MDFLKSDNDFHTTVEKALNEIDPSWDDYMGLLVVGTHEPVNVEPKIRAIREARNSNKPFLGICMGMQLMMIEYARNVLCWTDANSTEIDFNTDHPVIEQMAKLRVGIKEVEWQGITSRESHWHNYKFNSAYREYFSPAFDMSYTDGILEIAQLKDHPFFMGVQFHPEYGSRLNNPHPILIEFLNSCRNAKRN